MFTSDIINTTNGTILTTKLQKFEEEEEEDDDKNNVSFEKLSEDNHPFGLSILKFRERLTRVIEKHNVRKFNIISIIVLLNFNRLQ